MYVHQFSLPAMRSLPIGSIGSERMTSASCMLASKGLLGGTRPNGCPRIPVCMYVYDIVMCMGVLLVCDNYQGLTLHIKWSINGGWEICNVWILLIVDSFVFPQYRQWTPLNKPIHGDTTVKTFKKKERDF